MILKAICCSGKTLKGMVDYACDAEKTDGLIGTYGCGERDPVRNMKAVKIAHNKNTGIECAHFVLSPAPDDNVSPGRMLEITRKFASHFKKFQSVFAVHQNTDVIHSHIILNSVGTDGTRFRQYKTQLAELKNFVSNCICPKYGISGITGCVIKTNISSDEDMEFTEDDLNKLTVDTFSLVCNEAYASDCDDDEWHNPFDTGDDDRYDWEYQDDDIFYNERMSTMSYGITNFSANNQPALADCKRIRVFNQFNINAETAEEASKYTKRLLSAIPEYINECDRRCGGKENIDVINNFNVYVDSSPSAEPDYQDDDEEDYFPE